jgi:hypothetical protein
VLLGDRVLALLHRESALGILQTAGCCAVSQRGVDGLDRADAGAGRLLGPLPPEPAGAAEARAVEQLLLLEDHERVVGCTSTPLKIVLHNSQWARDSCRACNVRGGFQSFARRGRSPRCSHTTFDSRGDVHNERCPKRRSRQHIARQRWPIACNPYAGCETFVLEGSSRGTDGAFKRQRRKPHRAHDLVTQLETVRPDQVSLQLVACGERLVASLWRANRHFAAARIQLATVVQLRREILEVCERLERVLQEAKFWLLKSNAAKPEGTATEDVSQATPRQPHQRTGRRPRI